MAKMALSIVDRQSWRYDPYTGAKISKRQHAWYVLDAFFSRHLRKLMVFDVVAATAVVLVLAVLVFHPSLTFGLDRMRVETPLLPAAAQSTYYRSLLSSEEAEFYDAVYNALLGCRAGLDAPKGMHQDRAGEIVDAVLMDHPEIFWTSHWSYHGLSSSYSVMFAYLIDDPAEIAEKSALYQQMAYDAIYEFDSEYAPDVSTRKSAMAAYLYSWVCEHAEYVGDEGSGYDQTIMGVFEGDGCVCAGYARAYKYLCDKAGISCYYVVGGTDHERDSTHAWNVITFDDAESYFVDATWGDDGEKTAWHWYTKDRKMFDESHVASSLNVDDVIVEAPDK